MIKHPTTVSLPAPGARRRLAPVLGLLACLAAPVLQADIVFRFGFDEGSGLTVTNDAGSLTGLLGPAMDPTLIATNSPTSPSALTTDSSLGLADPLGFLLMNATNNPALHATTQPITAEAWIFMPEGTTFHPMGITGYGTTWKLAILPSGNLGFTLFDVADVDSGVFIPQGSWNHVAAAWTPGTGVAFFVNGVEVSTIPETGTMRAPGNSYLGVGGAGFSGEPLTGFIDRLRVHRVALTAAELDADAANVKAPFPSTVASFQFGETAAPFANGGSLPIPALQAGPIIQANQSPQFTTNSPSGKPGDRALTFDGNDLLEVPDPNQVWTLAGDFTAQAWVKFTTLPTTRQILMANFGPGGAFSFSITSGGVLFITTYGIADTTSSTAKVPDDGRWHHVAVVHRNGTDLRFYVDGVLGSTVPYTSGLVTRTATSFYIGGEFGTGLPFRGSIDRLQLDNTALAVKDLDSLAIPGVTPGAPTLAIGTAVSVAWPTASTGFLLQSTTNLNNSASWTNVTVSPIVIGDTFYTLLPATETETFFRLVRPE